MQLDVGHCMAVVLIFLVVGVWAERIVWTPRRPFLTWQMKGLRIVWGAAVLCAAGVATYGYDLRAILVAATVGALAGLIEVVSWTRLLPRRRARTPTSQA